jgi:hypothetical protein
MRVLSTRRSIGGTGVGVVGALLAASLATGVLAGGGHDLPDDAVAKVGDSVITRADFARQAERTPAAGMSAKSALDPPDFSECVAFLRQQAPDETPHDVLERNCKGQFDQLKGRVMGALLADEWLSQEARRRGVSVTGPEVKRALRSSLEGSTEKSDLRRYLSDPERGRGSMYDGVRVDLLEAKLKDRIARAPRVTDTDVERYFERRKDRFVRPERRDIRVVLTRTRPNADRARRVLEGGQSWAAVAKKHSIDPASRTRGGKDGGRSEW